MEVVREVGPVRCPLAEVIPECSVLKHDAARVNGTVRTAS